MMNLQRIRYVKWRNEKIVFVSIQMFVKDWLPVNDLISPYFDIDDKQQNFLNSVKWCNLCILNCNCNR